MHATLSAVEHAPEEAGDDDRLGRFRHVVIIDLPVPGGVAQGGLCAGKHHPCPLSFALDRCLFGQPPGWAEGPVHEIDAGQVVREPVQVLDPHFHGLHSDEDRLLVLV
jgi:hypothetical protein